MAGQGADYGLWGKGVIEAIDYQTGKIRWRHEVGPRGSGAGVLTTESGLVFTGDAEGNVLALRFREHRQDGFGTREQERPWSVLPSLTNWTAINTS